MPIQWTTFFYPEKEITQGELDSLMVGAGILERDGHAIKRDETGWCGWPTVYTEKAGAPCFYILSNYNCGWPNWMVDCITANFSGVVIERLNKDGERLSVEILGESDDKGARFIRLMEWELKEAVGILERKLKKVKELAARGANFLHEYYDVHSYLLKAQTLLDSIELYWDEHDPEKSKRDDKRDLQVGWIRHELETLMEARIAQSEPVDGPDLIEGLVRWEWNKKTGWMIGDKSVEALCQELAGKQISLILVVDGKPANEQEPKAVEWKTCPDCKDNPNPHCPVCMDLTFKPTAVRRAIFDEPQQHVLITPETCEDCKKDPGRNCLVCDGGLGICAKCGKGESELSEPCTPKEQPK